MKSLYYLTKYFNCFKTKKNDIMKRNYSPFTQGYNAKSSNIEVPKSFKLKSDVIKSHQLKPQKTDLRQNSWNDEEKVLLESNNLIPLTTVYFHKENEEEIVTCFKNTDGTFLLICKNNNKNETNSLKKNASFEETFDRLEEVIENASFEKMFFRKFKKCTEEIMKEIEDNPSDYPYANYLAGKYDK